MVPMLRRFALACTLATCATPAAAQTAAPAQAPRLLVFITVDQLRPDYFTRWPGQLTGGLARLWNGGAAFTDAHHDHAVTETAPGHASVMSGRFPRGTGIVSNEFGVGDPRSPLLGSRAAGASPARFRGTVLADWMRAKDPRTRVLSVARKDRGAILPVGRGRHTVLWYAPNGTFTTSTWYASTLPPWVRRFNARRLPHSYAGVRWAPLLPAQAYPEPDSVPAEAGGVGFTFPHDVPRDPSRAAADLGMFPFMDVLTLGLAMEGLRSMELGRGPATDVLAISLSTTDAIGHHYGPDSRELHDQVVRLDRALGAFLDSLYAVRDPATVLVALTADHGVTPYPEVADPANARAMHVSDGRLRAWMRATAREWGVDSTAIDPEVGSLRLDPAAFARAGRDPRVFAREYVEFARTVRGVLRADLFPDVAADSARDPIARRWNHMFPRDLPYYAVVTVRPGHVWGRGSYAQHGSPHDIDSRVPIIFYGAPFRPGRYDTFVRTVDIAPTLARVLGVRPTEPLDGRVLTQALR
jgi:predicted AlkP superfamily pyrophosphatase or phosphodiesterase